MWLLTAPPACCSAGGSLLAVRAELGRSEAEVRQLTERLEQTERQAADYSGQVRPAHLTRLAAERRLDLMVECPYLNSAN